MNHTNTKAPYPDVSKKLRIFINGEPIDCEQPLVFYEFPKIRKEWMAIHRPQLIFRAIKSKHSKAPIKLYKKPTSFLQPATFSATFLYEPTFL